ncbi:aminoglycoside phosphotransferase family protein [Actinocrispum sp. NPDC049592]|uniref:phosphotransferase family protein n=1 Tax=Actinocrispum sp. NPDC049592 TaxID=3154835 RepID=UPI003433C560
MKVYSDWAEWRQRKEQYVCGLLGGLPVPEVLEVLPGGVSVLSLLDGVPLSSVESVDEYEVYRQMGALLARIHAVAQPAFGYVVTEVLEPEATNLAYMSRQFAAKLADFLRYGGDPGLHALMEGYVERHRDLFAACSQAVLCHNDFHEGNILVTDGRVTGVVDMENAVAGDPVLDLAKVDYYAVRGSAAKFAGLLAGYGEFARDRLAIYKLYHALELWDWFASIGRTAPLPGIAADIRSFVDG